MAEANKTELRDGRTPWTFRGDVLVGGALILGAILFGMELSSLRGEVKDAEERITTEFNRKTEQLDKKIACLQPDVASYVKGDKWEKVYIGPGGVVYYCDYDSGSLFIKLDTAPHIDVFPSTGRK